MTKRGEPVTWRVITRSIRARDLFGAPSAGAADQRLKDCAEALEGFAEKVCVARERP